MDIRLVARFLLLALLASCAGCSGCSDDNAPVGTDPRAAAPLPPLTLTDDTEDLLLTWIDERGETHTEVAIADVHEKGRAQVRVVITDDKAGHGHRLYVADLSAKQPDGSYPVRTMRRSEWESLIEKRRQAYLARHVPRPPPTTSTTAPLPAEGGDKPLAIVYGAAWCKPCHVAKAYLERRGVRVIEKDIEKDPAAAAEMQRKLQRVGKGGASIPVIDLAGQILVGFSTAAVDRAIKKAQAGTRL